MRKYLWIEGLVIGAIFLVPLVLGVTSSEQSYDTPGWVPREVKVKKMRRKVNRVVRTYDPYETAQKDSYLWEEYLEEIDNLGFPLGGQDALEVWETKYQ